KHPVKSDDRIHVAADLCSAAKRVVGTTRPDITTRVRQLADGTQMIPGVIENTRVRPGCELNALRKESFGGCAVGVVFFTDPAAIPNQQAMRHFGAIQQLSNPCYATLAIVRELGPLVTGIHRRKPIDGIPLIGAGG